MQKNAKAPLSQVYNDLSALENMHCILTISLLRRHGLSFLLGPDHSSPPHFSGPQPTSTISAFSPTAYADPPSHCHAHSPPRTPTPASQARSRIDAVDFKKLVQGVVLATDMSMHFSFMASLGGMAARLKEEDAGSERTGGRVDEERDRLMLVQAIMKCADISNPVRVFSFFFLLVSS